MEVIIQQADERQIFPIQAEMLKDFCRRKGNPCRTFIGFYKIPSERRRKDKNQKFIVVDYLEFEKKLKDKEIKNVLEYYEKVYKDDRVGVRNIRRAIQRLRLPENDTKNQEIKKEIK